MALTRRTARFGELAALVHQECSHLGVDLPEDIVDAAINSRVFLVGDRMRIGLRAALAYAPDDLADDLAQIIVAHARGAAAGEIIDLDSRRE